MELLDRFKNKEIGGDELLRGLGSVKVFYSTPFGDHKDGGTRVFLLKGPDGTGYNPVFSSAERLQEFYNNVGRVTYMIMEATFLSVLETTKSVNENGAPVRMGLIIDPGYYDITVDAGMLERAIKIIQNV